jgi:hypothetical protein
MNDTFQVPDGFRISGWSEPATHAVCRKHGRVVPIDADDHICSWVKLVLDPPAQAADRATDLRDEGRQYLEDLRRGPDAQPEPTPGDAEVTPLVIADLQAWSDFGARKYGTRLQTFNGRDALVDAYQEALDLCCYLRQRIEEECWNDPLLPGYEPPAEEAVLVTVLGTDYVFVGHWNAADRLWRQGERGRRPEGTSWRPLPPRP